MIQQIDLTYIDEFLNPVYVPYLDNEDRFLICYGGAGSGKSYFAAQKMIIRCIQERNHKLLCIRKVARTLRNSVFPLLKQVISDFDLSHQFKINISEMKLTFKPNGNEIILLGLDDVEKLKSIHGITSVWIEEATEISESDFSQLDIRLRGLTENYKQIILSFNPISVTHWLKRCFFDEIQEDTTILKTNADVNQYIDEAYISRLDSYKEKDETFYQVYRFGEWGVLKGLIYNNYEIVKEMPDTFDDMFYGLDFGYQNPSALIEIRVKDQTAYIDETIYQNKLTTPQLVEEMIKLQVDPNSIIFADSAEPKTIEEIFQNGYIGIMPTVKGANSVIQGIRFVKGCKLCITDRSVNIKNEIQSYKYKEDKDGRAFEEPVKLKDHAMDAIRYALMGELPIFESPEIITGEDLGIERIEII